MRPLLNISHPRFAIGNDAPENRQPAACTTPAPALPPSNNMGAHITTQDTAPSPLPLENRVLIDWLSWTFKNIEDPLDAIILSGLEKFEFGKPRSGGMGYKHSIRSGNIVVYYDGQVGMGCHVSLTGSGCRQYETHIKNENCFYSLLHQLTAAGASYSRMDVAIDNVDGQLDLDKLQDACETKHVRTLFKSGHIIKKLSFTEDQDNGRTIYVGSPTSRLKIRFYDKAAQLKIEDQHWTRCELQLMGERAQEAVRHILKPRQDALAFGDLAFAVLNQYFTVVNLDDSNKSRCTIQSWWSAWLENTNKLKLTAAKVKKTIEQTKLWLDRAIAPTLAMVKEHHGVIRFTAFVSDLIKSGADRMNMKHEEILYQSRETAFTALSTGFDDYALDYPF